MTDLWHYWDAACAWKNGEGPQPIANECNPQLGFYRLPKRDGYLGSKTFEPVAYYLDDARIICCRRGSGDDARDLSTTEGEDLWIQVCEHPVTEEQYRRVAEQGKPWHDEHPYVGMQGHNKPPKDLSYEGLVVAIEDLANEAARRLKGPPVESQDESDQITNLADRLAELYRSSDKLFAEEQKPWKARLEDVKTRWKPLLETAEIYKQLKLKLVTPWLQRQRKAAAEAAARAAAAGEPVEIERVTSGTRGRAVSLREYKVAKIVDYRAALEFFADGQIMHDLVQDLCNKSARAGVQVPGVEIVIETKAV